MSEREDFESRSAHDLFGVMGGDFGSVLDVNVFYRVAEDLAEFRQELETHGLGVLCDERDDGAFGIISKGDKGLDFPFHYFKKDGERGVWISDIQQYRELMGLQ